MLRGIWSVELLFDNSETQNSVNYIAIEISVTSPGISQFVTARP